MTTTEYRVRWRRADWESAQTRVFQSQPAARRHINKLRGEDRPDLAPLEELEVHSRPVGKWTLEHAP